MNQRLYGVGNSCHLHGHVDSSTHPLTHLPPTTLTHSPTHPHQRTRTQEQVYEHMGRPIVTNALEGFNNTIFAYGQTGACVTRPSSHVLPYPAHPLIQFYLHVSGPPAQPPVRPTPSSLCNCHVCGPPRPSFVIATCVAHPVQPLQLSRVWPTPLVLCYRHMGGPVRPRLILCSACPAHPLPSSCFFVRVLFVSRDCVSAQLQFRAYAHNICAFTPIITNSSCAVVHRCAIMSLSQTRPQHTCCDFTDSH